jgi:hypothetical protein
MQKGVLFWLMSSHCAQKTAACKGTKLASAALVQPAIVCALSDGENE